MHISACDDPMHMLLWHSNTSGLLVQCENDLRPVLMKYPALCRYVETITQKHFSTPPRPPPTIKLTHEERAEVGVRISHE